MQTTFDESRAFLLKRLQDNLVRTESRARELRRVNSWLIVTVLLTTAAATVLAGFAAGAGPPIGEGTTAWRWTCGSIAVLSAISGLFTGAQQKFNVPERMAQLLSFAARLRGLELALSLSRREVADVAREYEDVVAQYPELHV